MKAHGEIINAIDGVGGVGCGAPEIATGSRDGIENKAGILAMLHFDDHTVNFFRER